MEKILNYFAKLSVAVSMFMASGVGDALRSFFEWLFDKGCDPSKHNLPGWEEVGRILGL